MHHNTVLLPNRTVFVCGGNKPEDGPESGTDVRQSELYDPSKNTWTELAIANISRWYHSEALLLPDGTVVTAGSNTAPIPEEKNWRYSILHIYSEIQKIDQLLIQYKMS
jgi:hypothetical protein